MAWSECACVITAFSTDFLGSIYTSAIGQYIPLDVNTSRFDFKQLIVNS